MVRWKRSAALLVALALLQTTSAPAHADPENATSEADADIARGLALRRARLDVEALAEFRRAYALEPSGRALAQVALAEDAVGLWVDAEQTFEAVLALQGDPWIDARRAALDNELRELRGHLADLDLEIAPADSEVWINGAPAQRNPDTRDFRVISGRVLVEVKRAGFEAERRVLEVPPARRTRVSLALTAASPAIATEPSAAPVERAQAVDPAPIHHEHGGARAQVQRVLAFSLLAAASSSLLLGIAGAIERQRAVDIYNDDSRCFYGGMPRSVRCAGVATDESRFTTVMTTGFVTAAISGIAGSIFALTVPPELRVDVGRPGRDALLVSVARRF
jgi:hypothetical protein